MALRFLGLLDSLPRYQIAHSLKIHRDGISRGGFIHKLPVVPRRLAACDLSTAGMNGFDYREGPDFNRRDVKLFTCRWLPANKEIKALVFLCHGYGVECSEFMKGTGIHLAQEGFAVFGIDYEGHGKSDGVRAYIKRFSDIVDDCACYFKTLREKGEYKDKACFLLGESMGGVVALGVHLKQPEDWSGAVLVAPMCKISKKMKPSPIKMHIFSKLSILFPTWKIIPNDIIEEGVKDILKRKQMRDNPYVYQDKLHFRSGLELLKASLDSEKRLKEVTLPFLVLHGGKDEVTDITASKALYEEAATKSPNKNIKIYKDMWHSLLFGEPQINIDHVMRDITTWLNTKCGQ